MWQEEAHTVIWLTERKENEEALAVTVRQSTAIKPPEQFTNQHVRIASPLTSEFAAKTRGP